MAQASVTPSQVVFHLVFVDFENVPTVDLDGIGELPVVVTLLIGKNQTKLDTSLVGQIHRHAAKVKLVEVGASGRNALDLTLAYYLGRALAETPQAQLYIVSKDKDFDPLIAHLQRADVPVVRLDSFAALPFLPLKKAVAGQKKPVALPKKSEVGGESSTSIDKLEKLVVRLTTHAGPRPKRKKSLLHHINTAYGNKLTAAELSELLEKLIERGVLAIDSQDKVSY